MLVGTPSVSLEPPRFLQLVSDRHRWQLLREQACSDYRVAELTELLREPRNLASYHLPNLRDAGLVAEQRGSADGRDIYYRVYLVRYRDLLGVTGVALYPGLRLSPASPQPRPPSKTAGAVSLHRNSARSQIAEALHEHRSGGPSAPAPPAVSPKALHPNAVRVMAEVGIDISKRLTKHLNSFARTRFDRLITLCDKVKEICPEFPGQPQAVHWSMPDPAAHGGTDEESCPAFRRTADELEVRAGLLIADVATHKPEGRTDAN